MPRQVDHQARRTQLAEALWRITAERGLEAVTLRQVAAEAGVSMGLVQHYFHSKDEMLLFAHECLRERAGHRFASLALPDDPRDRLRHVLAELLPLDEERVVEAHVALAFLARAAVEPGMAALLREGFVWLRDFLTAELHGLGVPDAEREAEVLLALHDGLVGQIVSGHHAVPSALAVLDAHLAKFHR